MFHDIPARVLERMAELERRDLADRDRKDLTMYQKLRQVPPEVGRFLAILAASAPAGRYLEIGTSGGYSTLWLALGCRAVGRKITTFELLPEKHRLARETFEQAGVGDVVESIRADALEHLPGITGVAFCFLDAEKDVYERCFDLVVPNLVPGGLLVADNAVSHAGQMRAMLDKAMSDPRLDSVVVPIGNGELVSRRN